MQKDDTKISKERSPLYPAFSINECLDFAKEINKIGGKKASVATVASAIGVSTTTNSFKSKISSAKQFGLIKGSANTVELTDIAKKIIYATDNSSIPHMLVECFVTAPLYQKLTSRYDNQAVPPADKLSNVLLLEYGITKAAKDIAATKFIESAEQVGVLQNGVLIMDPEELPNTKPSDGAVSKENTFDESSSRISSKDRLLGQPGYHFEIPTLSGAVAQVTIPKDVTEKDLDFISMYLQNMLPTFITNLKEQLRE